MRNKERGSAGLDQHGSSLGEGFVCCLLGRRLWCSEFEEDDLGEETVCLRELLWCTRSAGSTGRQAGSPGTRV